MTLSKNFGKTPDAARKESYKNLKNFENGVFQNLLPTPALTEGASMTKVFIDFFGKIQDSEPKQALPSEKNDLKNLRKTDNLLVWFGHSSYFMQVEGQTFLVEPVFSGQASPVPNSVKAFPGTDVYSVEDFPTIDYLLISHDHWDHLDFETVLKLKSKTKKVICGLGVGSHFEYWGFEKNQIIEKNWYETVDLEVGTITLTPARHFSGRLLRRNGTLWTSFVLKTPIRQFFLGGDSGYGNHFVEIGEKFGPFDLAILECGQYNLKWRYIHSLPDEIILESKELKTSYILPVHHSKFRLAQHAWYEPLEKLSELADEENLALITPKIGQIIDLDHLEKPTERWWKSLI